MHHFIILNEELVNHVNHFQTGFRVMIGGQMSWMANNICCAIKLRKMDLQTCSPGAVVGDKPKVICVKMIPKLNSSSNVMGVHTKYNDTLDTILEKSSYHGC